eukprot:419904-Heterocapsa_arctica.AAC.1
MCESAVQLRAKEARDAKVALRIAQITDTDPQDSPPGIKSRYEMGEQSDETMRNNAASRERSRLRDEAATASSS